MQEFERRGIWWHPSFPEHQFSGLLHFDEKTGASLEIIGSHMSFELLKAERNAGLPQTITIGYENPTRFEFLLGYSNGGEKITLWKVRDIGAEVAPIGYYGSKYQIGYVLSGHHFVSAEAIKFKSMHAYYSNLLYWLDDSTVLVDESENESLEETSIKYSHAKRRDIAVESYKISFVNDFQSATDGHTYFSGNRRAYVEVVAEEPEELESFLSGAIHVIRNFLMLGLGYPITMPGLIGATIENSSESDESSSVVERNVEIYYLADNVFDIRDFNIFDMWFRLEDIAQDLQMYLAKWFAISKTMKPVMDLYFGLFYIPKIYTHLEFLTLIQAIEAYHRRASVGLEDKYMSEEEWEPYRTQLNAAIPPSLDRSHKDSIRARIKYAFEFSLRKRLSILLTEWLADYDLVINHLVGKKPEFIETLVTTRNYLTHYTFELEQQATVDQDQMADLLQRMIYLVQLCFYHELGFTRELVTHLARGKSHRYRGTLY